MPLTDGNDFGEGLAMDRSMKNYKDITEDGLKSFVSELLIRNNNMDAAIEEFLSKMGAYFDVDTIIVK